eukprot:662429-Lingulodinium_polyedra.AAC.1
MPPSRVGEQTGDGRNQESVNADRTAGAQPVPAAEPPGPARSTAAASEPSRQGLGGASGSQPEKRARRAHQTGKGSGTGR